MQIDAERVRGLRSAKNWSQEKLSEASGLSLRTVQRLENTGRGSIESVRALAEAFAVDPTELTAIATEESLTPVDAVRRALLDYANFTARRRALSSGGLRSSSRCWRGRWPP